MQIALEPSEPMGRAKKLPAIRGDQVGWAKQSALQSGAMRWGGVDQQGLAPAPSNPLGRKTDLPANSVNRVENRFTRRRQGQGDPFRIRTLGGK